MTRVFTLLNLLSFLFLSQSTNPVLPSTQLKLKTNLKSSINEDVVGEDNLKLSSRKKLSPIKLQQVNSKRMSPGNDSGKSEAITLEMKICYAYPSIVKVEEPGDWGTLYWPSFVELHRCAGGCFVSPRLKQCTVTQQDNLTIKVKNVATKLEINIAMSNHTACECRCIPRECNARERYDDNECSCKCIEDGSQCKERDNKRWNKQLCQCECYTRLNCGFGETWNSDACKCEPDETISVRLL